MVAVAVLVTSFALVAPAADATRFLCRASRIQTVPVPAACIPTAVRSERPRLDAVARRLSIETSDRPLGHEDLVCLLAERGFLLNLEADVS